MPTWTAMRDLATDDLVTEADMDAIRGNIEYLLDPNRQRILRDNGSYYATTSTAFVDVDATNLAATLDTHGGPVLALVSGSAWNASAGSAVYLDLAVDGARVGASFAGLLLVTSIAAGEEHNASFALLVTGLAAGSHTFKLQWKVNGGTGNLRATAASIPLGLTVIEL